MANSKKAPQNNQKNEFVEYKNSLKQDENLKSLYGFAQNKLDKNSVTSEIVDGKVVFALKEKGKNGKTIQMTQDQVIASMNRIQELSKELRQESAEKATKIKNFQGARLAQTKSKVGAFGKLLATQEEYLNGKTSPEFQTIEAKQKELLFLQNQLNLVAGSYFNMYNNNLSANTGYTQSSPDSRGLCATGGMWFLTAAGNQILQKATGNRGDMAKDRLAVSDVVKEPFVGFDENGNKMVGNLADGSANSLIKPLMENDKGLRSVGTLAENQEKLEVGDIIIYEGNAKHKHGHIFQVVGFEKNESGEDDKSKPKFASDFFQKAANVYSDVDDKIYNSRSHVFRGNSVVAQEFGIDNATYTELQMNLKKNGEQVNEKTIIDTFENARQNPNSKEAMEAVDDLFKKAGMQTPKTFTATPENRPQIVDYSKISDEKLFEESKGMKYQNFTSEKQKLAQIELQKRIEAVSNMSEAELEAKYQEFQENAPQAPKNIAKSAKKLEAWEKQQEENKSPIQKEIEKRYEQIQTDKQISQMQSGEKSFSDIALSKVDENTEKLIGIAKDFKAISKKAVSKLSSEKQEEYENKKQDSKAATVALVAKSFAEKDFASMFKSETESVTKSESERYSNPQIAMFKTELNNVGHLNPVENKQESMEQSAQIRHRA